MRKYGFTGSREEPPFEQATALRFWLEATRGELHHGCCVGRDKFVHEVAKSLRGWCVVGHPGDTPSLRADVNGYDVLLPVKANLERNTDIVAEADEMFAAPRGAEEVRSGTWSTIRKARRSGKPLTIFWPDGSVTRENGAL